MICTYCGLLVTGTGSVVLVTGCNAGVVVEEEEGGGNCCVVLGGGGVEAVLALPELGAAVCLILCAISLMWSVSSGTKSN